jgi:E3 ubiquitin-protein ligase RNF38/44
MDVHTPLISARTTSNFTGNHGDVELGGGGPSNLEVNPERPVEFNILGEGVQGINTTRYLTILITVVNIPQVLAGFFVLALNWYDSSACDSEYTAQWKFWSVVQLILISMHTIMRLVIWRAGEAHVAVSHALTTAKNALEALGLIWFVTGNLWLFGGQDETCTDASESPIYQLCLALIIILYIQICLPCILAVLMVPVLCFCLPCVVRILSYLHDPMAGRGASEHTINTLPVIKYGDSSLDDHDSGLIMENTCPICLIEYSVGDELRKLPCSHALHKTCLDSWLIISATCPNCRTSIYPQTTANHAISQQPNSVEIINEQS